MPAYKCVRCTGTVSSIEDATNALEELGGECREVVDNASEGLSQTQRIQTLSETADALDCLQSWDIPEAVRELPIEYDESVPTRKRMQPSRSVRCANATSVLQAALEALEAWQADNEKHEEIDEVQQLCSELEELISAAEGCEFPGMFS
jgi:hypothetical protein